MTDTIRISDEPGAWEHLGNLPDRVTCLERHDFLPFHLLSDVGFEICCFVLLLREHPGDRIYYYGKSGDKGRDIVWHHADGTVEFVQCKRYKDSIDVGEVRKELAKLCANVFERRLPANPDRVSFYVVPDLSSGAQDLIASREEWNKVAARALEEHLKSTPSLELLAFAQNWWPAFDRVAGVALGARVERHETLMERFFAVKKVVEDVRPELQAILEHLKTMPTGLSDAAHVVSGSGGGGSKESVLTRSQDIVARGRDRTWEDRARRTLDAQGLRLWEDIRADVRGMNSVRALDAGKHLREWLSGDGSHASPAVRGRVCILLADLAVIDSGLGSLFERFHLADARAWQGRAMEELGDAPSAEDASRLIYLGARLTWLEGDPAAAIAILDEADDTNCRSLKLSVLIAEERDQEAVAVARSLPPDDRWCDRLVLAYARTSLSDEVAAVTAWALDRPEPALHHHCVIALAQGTAQRLFRGRDQRSLFMGLLSADETHELRHVLAALEPLAAPAVGRGRPGTGLEAEAVEIAFVVSRLLGLTEAWHRYGALLGKAKPVSAEYARAVCRGELRDDGTVSARLRADYPRSFAAGYMAAVIDALRGEGFRRIAEAVDALLSLAGDEQRDQLAGLLFETALRDEGVGALQESRAWGQRVLGLDHRLLRAVECELLRRSGDTAASDALLESSRDESDPLWLQQAAQADYRRGARADALLRLLRAARILGRAETYHQALSLAHHLGDAAAMREVLQALARITPDDATVHRNLGILEFKAGRFREAVGALQRVECLTPGTAENGFALAQALALAGRGDEAVPILDRLAATRPTDLPPAFLRTVILDALGKAVLAFEGLHAARDRFWGDPAFVHLYHTLASKVNREEEAYHAFLQLLSLQEGNPDGPLRAVTLEEVREHARATRERRDAFNRQLLAGRLPWPMIGRALHREAYFDWVIRTQDLPALPDAPLARAEYAVYATHAFAVRSDAAGPRTLPRLEPPSRGQPVVMDLSALITLHRLGLLDRALAYAGRVYLPAGFVPRFLDEQRSLQPHQASETEARRAILSAVDEQRIRPSASPDGVAAPTPVLDEYPRDDQPADFHLVDAVNWLLRVGRLTPEEGTRFRKACSRTPAAAGEFQAAARSGVRVGLLTLITVHKAGLLDRFLRTITVLLTPDEIEELRRDQFGAGRRAEMNAWTRDLHAFVAGDERVETAEPRRADAAAGEDETEEPWGHDPSIDAALLANERQLPLLADDRCLLAVVSNARQGQLAVAFGTDNLLAGLAAAGELSPAEYASAWLQLARWRYRFLVPPPEVLVELAARHPGFPPGEELREVGRYLHDCCQDPGLLCGPEPTDPPVPLALRYFHQVLESIAGFMTRVWHDDRFDGPARAALAHWAVSECVPPPPRSLPYAPYTLACENIPRLLLVGVLGDPAGFSNSARTNEALTGLAAALDVGPEEYDEIVTMVLEDELAPADDPQARAADLQIRRALATTALRQREGMGLRTASLVAELGLLPPLDGGIDGTDLDALRDPSHPRRGGSIPPGPWVFLRGADPADANVAYYTPDLIFDPRPAVREAAARHLASAPDTTASWLTPGSRQAAAATVAEIGGGDKVTTRRAAGALHTMLSRDFLLALARLRQSRAARFEREHSDAVRCILEPAAGTLHSIPPPWYRLPGDEWEAFCRALAAEATVAATLDRYYGRFGHLPLATPQAVETALGAWVDAHGPEGVWEAVQVWADDPCRPLKRYHASRIFLSRPDLVPPEARAAGWAAVSDLLRGYAAEPGSPTLTGAAWQLLHRLAGHYLHLLEVGSYEPDGTALAALAWWAAERVTEVMVSTVIAECGHARAAGVVNRISDGTIRPFTARSAVGWVLSHPARQPPSTLVHATLQLGSLWRTAVLEAGPGAGLAVADEPASEIVQLLGCATVIGFPTQGGATQATLAVDVPQRSVTGRWLEAIEGVPPDDPPTDGEVSPPVVSDHGPEPELRTLWELEDEARVVVLQRFRTTVGLGTQDLDAVRWVLEDTAWWDRTFESLSDDQLGLLCAALYEVLRTGGEEWALALPHLLRGQAMRADLSPDRRKFATAAVLQSCMISGGTSALVLLAREASAPEVQKTFDVWRRQFQGLRRVSPTAVQARLRTILVHLPPDGLCE